MTGKCLCSLLGSGLYMSGKLFEQTMEELLLSQCNYGKVFHTEQRRRSANWVFGINHYDTAVAQLPVFFYEAGYIDILGEYFIGKFQIGLKVFRVLEQVLHRPEGISFGASAGQRRHISTADFQSYSFETVSVLHILIHTEKFVKDIAGIRLAGRNVNFMGARFDGTAHTNKVCLFFGKLKQWLPGWVVIDIELIRVRWVDLESTYFIEINCGPVNQLTVQRSHQSFSPAHHNNLPVENPFDRSVHGLFLFDNRLYQFHLCAAAVEIVSFAMNLVVDVTCQIVGKKSDKLFKGD